MSEPPPDVPPLDVTDEQMRAALERGDAAYLSRVVTDFARHHGGWWMRQNDHLWFRITEPDLATMLDDAAARMAQADNAITRTTAPPPDSPAAPIPAAPVRPTHVDGARR